MDKQNPLPLQFPDLSLQVFSFFELATLALVIAMIYYFCRRGLMGLRNLGLLQLQTRSYRILNMLSFGIPATMFIYGFHLVSRNSFFISLLFFIVVSCVIGFVLVDPARSLFATLLIHLKGDLKDGDYVHVAEKQGKIQQIGPFNLVILNRNGDRIFIPMHQVLRQSYEIRKRGGGPVFSLELSGRHSKEKIEQLAHLCPYKKSTSKVTLTQRGNNHLLTLEAVRGESRDAIHRYFEAYLS